MTPASEMTKEHHPQTAKVWWRLQRKKYNLGLLIAGITAFLCYTVIATYFIAPYKRDFEINGLITFLQGIAYLIMMGVANVFYTLGYLLDQLLNKDNHQQFRVDLFNVGFWFSCALPFLIPLLVFTTYLIHYRHSATHLQ